MCLCGCAHTHSFVARRPVVLRGAAADWELRAKWTKKMFVEYDAMLGGADQKSHDSSLDRAACTFLCCVCVCVCALCCVCVVCALYFRRDAESLMAEANAYARTT